MSDTKPLKAPLQNVLMDLSQQNGSYLNFYLNNGVKLTGCVLSYDDHSVKIHATEKQDKRECVITRDHISSITQYL